MKVDMKNIGREIKKEEIKKNMKHDIGRKEVFCGKKEG